MKRLFAVIMLVLSLSVALWAQPAVGEPYLSPSWDWDYRVAEALECLDGPTGDWQTASYESIPVWVTDGFAICIEPAAIQWRFRLDDYRTHSGICDEQYH